MLALALFLPFEEDSRRPIVPLFGFLFPSALSVVIGPLVEGFPPMRFYFDSARKVAAPASTLRRSASMIPCSMSALTLSAGAARRPSPIHFQSSVISIWQSSRGQAPGGRVDFFFYFFGARWRQKCAEGTLPSPMPPKTQEPRHRAQKRPKTFIFRKWRPARTMPARVPDVPRRSV